jgi:multidrug efflux pump subunit AcrA (membrane-fusion protein)
MTKWLGACLLIALSACSPLRRAVPTSTPLPPPVSYEKTIFTVERGPIVSEFTVVGEALPSRQDELFFRASGFASRVTVQVGDTAQAGDLLAELQVDDLLKQLEQAHIDLDVAQARLADIEKARRYAIARAERVVTIRQIEVDLARAALAKEAELSLAVAEEQLAGLQARRPDYDAALLTASINVTKTAEALAQAQIEYQESLDRTWEKQEVRDSYAQALRQAEWDHEIAQVHYQQALASLEVYQHDIKIQELTVAQAKAKLAESQEGGASTLTLQLKLAEENLALAKLDLEEASEEVSLYQKQTVERAQLTVERLEAQLAERQIIAPYDCVVLPRRGQPLRPGDSVEAFKPVFTVGDPAELMIATDRTHDRIGEVREDTKVHFSLAHEASESYDAQLMTNFYPLGETDKDQALSQDLLFFAILSSPERDEIPVGKTVYLTVVLGRSDDALLLPPATIRSFRGRDFVIVQEGDQQRRVDVRIGLESDECVEVIGDLQEGDQVVGP